MAVERQDFGLPIGENGVPEDFIRDPVVGANSNALEPTLNNVDGHPSIANITDFEKLQAKLPFVSIEPIANSIDNYFGSDGKGGFGPLDINIPPGTLMLRLSSSSDNHSELVNYSFFAPMPSKINTIGRNRIGNGGKTLSLNGNSGLIYVGGRRVVHLFMTINSAVSVEFFTQF